MKTKLFGALKLVLLALVGLGSMVLLMVWLAGGFTQKVPPGPPGALPPLPAGLTTAPVEVARVPLTREVVGSIAAEHEIAVASQLLGRVAEVRVTSGQRIGVGEILVKLEEAEHRTRLDQAQALLTQAEDHYARTEQQRRAEVATEAQLVQARTSLEAARARNEEAKTFLGKTAIRAPSAGVVVERLCEEGDTLAPGQVVARLYDRLQLVATVPESLQSHLSIGQEVGVRVDALGDQVCAGRVTEIVPQAQALSRAFRVKVSGPCPPGLIPGMFGRMRIPLGEREEIRVPEGAIRRVGQIPMVFRLHEKGQLIRQFVQTGPVSDGHVVITSGLERGDRIVLDASRVAAGEGGRGR